MAKRSPPSITMTQARAAFAKVLSRAERGDAVEVTRSGKPVAVIVSVQQYAAATTRSELPSKAFRAFMAGLDRRVLGGPDPWRGLRDRSSGRDFRW